ncbi:MAG: class I SAM-dependent methyltransferase [Aigarchaeota archaeon]|nr:class I SAM-dependent methyltransferase [Aigarchaeota archaeon]
MGRVYGFNKPEITTDQDKIQEVRQVAFWDEEYISSPPWDIGHPQPALVELVRNREMRPGRVLDVGCGTGDNSIFLAKSGLSVVGIDIAKGAIGLAKAKAIERNATVDFQVANALELYLNFRRDEFDNVLDSGLFHTLGDEERPVFASQINRVLHIGGKYFMLCFSEKETSKGGPRRVAKDEIKETFSEMFKINHIRETVFESRFHPRGAKAYVTSASKVRVSEFG